MGASVSVAMLNGRAERGKVIWQVYAWRSEYCQRVRVNAREGPDKRDIRICPEIAT